MNGKAQKCVYRAHMVAYKLRLLPGYLHSLRSDSTHRVLNPTAYARCEYAYQPSSLTNGSIMVGACVIKISKSNPDGGAYSSPQHELESWMMQNGLDKVQMLHQQK